MSSSCLFLSPATRCRLAVAFELSESYRWHFLAGIDKAPELPAARFVHKVRGRLSPPPHLSGRSPLYLYCVGGFAVQRGVEARQLLFRLHAQPDDSVQDLQDDERHAARPDPGCANRDRLPQQLLRVAVEEAVGATGVHSDSGKQ